MSDKEFVIEMEDDTEGHGWRGIVEPEEADWLEDRLRRDSGKTSFRIALGDEGEDTEGHGLRGGPVVRVSLGDEDDTEGHAISIHFPSRDEADAFRRRLLVTGVLVGTVALGAAGGVGLSALQSDDGAAGAGAVQSSVTGSDWTQAERPAGALSGTQAGAMDVNEARAIQAAGAEAYSNYQEAAANEAARQGGAESAAQSGPMDANEARAIQAAQAEAYANSQEAAANEGARQGGAASSAQSGPMDVNEARALQSSTTDDDSAELNDIGGPTPR